MYNVKKLWTHLFMFPFVNPLDHKYTAFPFFFIYVQTDKVGWHVIRKLSKREYSWPYWTTTWLAGKPMENCAIYIYICVVYIIYLFSYYLLYYSAFTLLTILCPRNQVFACVCGACNTSTSCGKRTGCQFTSLLDFITRVSLYTLCPTFDAHHWAFYWRFI